MSTSSESNVHDGRSDSANGQSDFDSHQSDASSQPSKADINELVLQAMEEIGSARGCSRNQIADYLKSHRLIEPTIRYALVQKALYKAVSEGMVYRPTKGSQLYRLKKRSRKAAGGVAARKWARNERKHNKKMAMRRKKSRGTSRRRTDDY